MFIFRRSNNNSIIWIHYRLTPSPFPCTFQRKCFFVVSLRRRQGREGIFPDQHKIHCKQPYEKVAATSRPSDSSPRSSSESSMHRDSSKSPTVAAAPPSSSLPSAEKKKRWWERVSSSTFTHAWLRGNATSNHANPVPAPEKSNTVVSQLDDEWSRGGETESMYSMNKGDTSRRGPSSFSKEQAAISKESTWNTFMPMDTAHLEALVGRVVMMQEGKGGKSGGRRERERRSEGGGARRAFTVETLPQLRWIRSITLRSERAKRAAAARRVGHAQKFQAVEDNGKEKGEEEEDGLVQHYIHLVRDAAYARQKEGPLAQQEAARHWLLCEMMETKIEHRIRQSMMHDTARFYGSFFSTSGPVSCSCCSSSTTASAGSSLSPATANRVSSGDIWDVLFRFLLARNNAPESRKEFGNGSPLHLSRDTTEVGTAARTTEKGMQGIQKEGGEKQEKKARGTSYSSSLSSSLNLSPSSAAYSSPSPSPSSLSLWSSIDEIILSESDLAAAHSLDLVPMLLMHSYLTHCYSTSGHSFPLPTVFSFPSPLSLAASTSFFTFSFSSLFPSMRRRQRRQAKGSDVLPSTPSWPAPSLIRAAIVGMAVGYCNHATSSCSVPVSSPYYSTHHSSPFVILSSNPMKVAMSWCVSFLECRYLPSPHTSYPLPFSLSSPPSLTSSSSHPRKEMEWICWVLPFSFKSIIFSISSRPFRFSPSFFNPSIHVSFPTAITPWYFPSSFPRDQRKMGAVVSAERGNTIATGVEEGGRGWDIPSEKSAVVATEGFREAWELAKCIPPSVLRVQLVFLARLEAARRRKAQEEEKDEKNTASSSGLHLSSPSSRISQDDPPACFFFLPGILTAAQINYNRLRRRERYRKEVSSSSLPLHQPSKDKNHLWEGKNWLEANCLCWTNQNRKENLVMMEEEKEQQHEKLERSSSSTEEEQEKEGDYRTRSSSRPWNDHPHPHHGVRGVHSTCSFSSSADALVPSMVWDTYVSVSPPRTPPTSNTVASSSLLPSPVTQGVYPQKDGTTLSSSSRPPSQGNSSIAENTSPASVVFPIESGSHGRVALGRLMGLCRHAGEVEHVVRLFKETLLQRWKKYEENSMHRDSIQNNKDGCDHSIRGPLLALASEIPSPVLVGIHPAVFNHTLAVLALQKEWTVAFAWYRRLLSVLDRALEKKGSLPAPLPINFFTHFVVVQMFLSPSALVPRQTKKNEPSLSGVLSPSSSPVPPPSFYNEEALEVCRHALRCCKGEIRMTCDICGHSSFSFKSLPPPEVLWSRGGGGKKGEEGVGLLLEERLALWEMEVGRKSFPPSFSSLLSTLSIPSLKEKVSCMNTEQSKAFISSGLRRCLIHLLSLLLCFPSYHIPRLECEVDNVCPFSPELPFSVLYSQKEPKGEKRNQSVVTYAKEWGNTVRAVVKSLADWYSMAAFHSNALPTSEESRMVDAVCLSIVMLMSVRSSLFLRHSGTSHALSKGVQSTQYRRGKIEKEEKEKKNMEPMESNSFLSDPLYDVLHESGLLSSLRMWVNNSQTRLDHIINVMLHQFIDIHQEQQSVLRERESRRKDHIFCITREEEEERDSKCNVGIPSSPPPFLTLFFSSSLETHPQDILRCITRFMGYAEFAPTYPVSEEALLGPLLDTTTMSSDLSLVESSTVSSLSSSSSYMRYLKKEGICYAANTDPPAHNEGEKCGNILRTGKTQTFLGGRNGRSGSAGCAAPRKPNKRTFTPPSQYHWQRWASLLTLFTEDVHEGPDRQGSSTKHKTEAPTSSGTSSKVELHITHGATIVVASGSDALAALSFLAQSLPLS